MNIEELTLKQIREIAQLVNGTVQQPKTNNAHHPFIGKYVIALCDEIESLQQQLEIYEKHGVTCQTFGHTLTGCAECNRDDDADNAMAMDTIQLQARQYFELLPDVERLREEVSGLNAALKMALDALDHACGGRCNAEYNPCHARLAADTVRTGLK